MRLYFFLLAKEHKYNIIFTFLNETTKQKVNHRHRKKKVRRCPREEPDEDVKDSDTHEARLKIAKGCSLDSSRLG